MNVKDFKEVLSRVHARCGKATYGVPGLLYSMELFLRNRGSDEEKVFYKRWALYYISESVHNLSLPSWNREGDGYKLCMASYSGGASRASELHPGSGDSSEDNRTDSKRMEWSTKFRRTTAHCGAKGSLRYYLQH